MLTKWCKELLTIPKGTEYIFGVSSAKACIIAKNAGGQTCYTGPSTYYQTANILTGITASGNSASAGLALGSGDTPPTENDYTVETIISNLTGTNNPNIYDSYDSSTGIYTVYLDTLLSNATASDITVKEICRFTRVPTGSALGQTVSGNYVSIMMDRTVLDTPLTVPAGGTKTLRYAYHYQMDKAATT